MRKTYTVPNYAVPNYAITLLKLSVFGAAARAIGGMVSVAKAILGGAA